MKNKALNRVFSILLFVSVFGCLLSSTAFASSGGQLVEVKPNSTAPVSSLTNAEKDFIVDQALNNYFPKVTGYAKTCARATLSAALKLYEEKNNGDINGLQYFLKSVALSARSLTASSLVTNYLGWRSAGDTLMSVNNALVENGVFENGVDWDQFSTDTALTAVQRFIDPSSGEEKENKRLPSAEDVTISSDVFKEYIDDTANLYTPKNAPGRMSFRTDSAFKKYMKSHSNSDYYYYWTFYNADTFAALGDNSNEMYMMFFYKNGSDTYYSQYQFHFTMSTQENWYEDRDEILFYGYTLEFEFWDMMNGSRDKSTTSTIYSNADYPYCFLEVLGDSKKIYFNLVNNYLYPSLIESSKKSSFEYAFSDYDSKKLFTPDYASSVDLRSIRSHFTVDPYDATYEKHDEKCSSKGLCDFGYIASATPIKMDYNIDTTKIPDNYYVTIAGDTVYDYHITNPETGESDTINNYVTNNYTYVTNNNPGGGGSSGGNITVGGKVEVGGSVGIDINVNVPDININVNQGNVGGGGNATSLPNTDAFNSYFDDALDESSGFRQFLSSFFGFLPVEIIGLLGIGLTLAILARLFGR